ncbi:hypothetical protein [Dysgonomonas sp. 25]|uniref:hypothetical protein n=1 Tax=Dysgonomonas sp. 25 TaxID=2302933 RepID=UPI0013D644F5|nr:hypothetical protein [Dysgonomonas sp. 25]NDV69369.1 hypothetical protein [Dysgonomonas sp. 25]
MEKNFNEQDSLRLIDEMIAQTRNNIRIGSANSMIFCGYYTAAVALLNVLLFHLLPNPYLSFWVWALTIPMAIIARIIASKQDKRSIVRTHIDRIVAKIWQGYTFSVFILLGCIYLAVFIFEVKTFTLIIMPSILALTGLAEYATGIATNFKPFVRGAFIFWLGALLSVLLFFVAKQLDFQFIILAICMVTGFIIPGHILNRKAKEHV